MKDVCDNPEQEQLWYQDLERYRQRPGSQRKPVGVHDERMLVQSASAIVAGLERQQLSIAQAHTTLRRWYEQTRGTMRGCRVGWLMDYVRLTYDYFGTQ